jgi:hypothetical protein
MLMPVTAVANLVRRASAANRSSSAPRRFRSTATGCGTALGSLAEALGDQPKIKIDPSEASSAR